MGLGGISPWSLIALIAFAIFLWWSIKIARHSFSIMKKSNDAPLDNKIEKDNGFSFTPDEINFISNNLMKEVDIISTEEIIPLDNRHGSSPLISEFEFSKTTNNVFKVNKTTDLNGRIKTNLWTLIETEVKKNLTKTIGIEIGEQITKRATVRLEAAPGKMVKYKLSWKQKKREGLALISLENKQLEIPYNTTYGLFHSVESINV